jgi:two-component system sensor histidine kinase VanS
MVENTGEQLSEELLSTIVEPFQRGSGRIREGHAGVGLGLAIVNSITQAHGGTLTLIPRAEGGLRVMVDLPAETQDAGRVAGKAERGREHAAAPGVALVVERGSGDELRPSLR